ncbi:MAG TPA: hypothetical protein VH309_00395, partial [Elusimicrobiota bacterium]|nr:hypothetical protein [Elusimicrobiota bacterium]
AMPLPLALVLLDAWPLRRLPASPREWLGPRSREVWRRVLPFFVLSAAIAAVTIAAQRDVGAVETLARAPFGRRAAQAAIGLTFYIGKTLWPAALGIYEVRWAPALPAALLGAAAVAALAAAAAIFRGLRSPVFAALAYHSLMLAPTLGVVAYGHELVADRYSYLPAFGLAALAALGCRALARRRPLATAALGLIVLGALAAATRAQIRMWRDETSLWRAVLRVDPLSMSAHSNLPKALLDTGRDGEALLMLEEGLRLYPDSPKIRVEIARLAARIGDGPREHALIHERLGREFAARGEYVKASWHYRRALEETPGSKGLRAELAAAIGAAKLIGQAR